MAHRWDRIAATGIISDWGLALLPVAGLWNTQLKLRRKVVIWTLMGMGLLYVFKLVYSSILIIPSTGVCPLVRLLQIKKYAVPELPHCKSTAYRSKQSAIPTYRCCRGVIRSGSVGGVSSSRT